MEGRIEDTFYKDLKREWRSGSIAVMTDSFKNLPFVVSTKVTFVKTRGTFHLYEKICFSSGKPNGTGLSIFHGFFLENLEYFRSYSSFLVFTGMIGKSLFHLLFHTIPMLLDEIRCRFDGKCNGIHSPRLIFC